MQRNRTQKGHRPSPHARHDDIRKSLHQLSQCVEVCLTRLTQSTINMYIERTRSRGLTSHVRKRTRDRQPTVHRKHTRDRQLTGHQKHTRDRQLTGHQKHTHDRQPTEHQKQDGSASAKLDQPIRKKSSFPRIKATYVTAASKRISKSGLTRAFRNGERKSVPDILSNCVEELDEVVTVNCESADELQDATSNDEQGKSIDPLLDCCVEEPEMQVPTTGESVLGVTLNSVVPAGKVPFIVRDASSEYITEVIINTAATSPHGDLLTVVPGNLSTGVASQTKSSVDKVASAPKNRTKSNQGKAKAQSAKRAHEHVCTESCNDMPKLMAQWSSLRKFYVHQNSRMEANAKGADSNNKTSKPSSQNVDSILFDDHFILDLYSHSLSVLRRTPNKEQLKIIKEYVASVMKLKRQLEARNCTRTAPSWDESHNTSAVTSAVLTSLPSNSSERSTTLVTTTQLGDSPTYPRKRHAPAVDAQSEESSDTTSSDEPLYLGKIRVRAPESLGVHLLTPGFESATLPGTEGNACLSTVMVPSKESAADPVVNTPLSSTTEVRKPCGSSLSSIPKSSSGPTTGSAVSNSSSATQNGYPHWLVHLVLVLLKDERRYVYAKLRSKDMADPVLDDHNASVAFENCLSQKPLNFLRLVLKVFENFKFLRIPRLFEKISAARPQEKFTEYDLTRCLIKVTRFIKKLKTGIPIKTKSQLDSAVLPKKSSLVLPEGPTLPQNNSPVNYIYQGSGPQQNNAVVISAQVGTTPQRNVVVTNAQVGATRQQNYAVVSNAQVGATDQQNNAVVTNAQVGATPQQNVVVTSAQVGTTPQQNVVVTSAQVSATPQQNNAVVTNVLERYVPQSNNQLYYLHQTPVPQQSTALVTNIQGSVLQANNQVFYVHQGLQQNNALVANVQGSMPVQNNFLVANVQGSMPLQSNALVTNVQGSVPLQNNAQVYYIHQGSIPQQNGALILPLQTNPQVNSAQQTSLLEQNRRHYVFHDYDSSHFTPRDPDISPLGNGSEIGQTRSPSNCGTGSSENCASSEEHTPARGVAAAGITQVGHVSSNVNTNDDSLQKNGKLTMETIISGKNPKQLSLEEEAPWSRRRRVPVLRYTSGAHTNPILQRTLQNQIVGKRKLYRFVMKKQVRLQPIKSKASLVEGAICDDIHAAVDKEISRNEPVPPVVSAVSCDKIHAAVEATSGNQSRTPVVQISGNPPAVVQASVLQTTSANEHCNSAVQGASGYEGDVSVLDPLVVQEVPRNQTYISRVQASGNNPRVAVVHATSRHPEDKEKSERSQGLQASSTLQSTDRASCATGAAPPKSQFSAAGKGISTSEEEESDIICVYDGAPQQHFVSKDPLAASPNEGPLHHDHSNKEGDEETRYCAKCKKLAVLMCSLCRISYYCSKQCQEKQWDEVHYTECTGLLRGQS